jgi:ABC-type transport system involved in multi-copper enzyme maturation permease subunit
MISLAINPIIGRELQRNSRSFKTMFFGLFTVALLGMVILLLWPRSGVFSSANTRELFTIFLNTNLTLVLLLTPGFTATSITTEREQRTFSLLFCSLLKPWEILWGKLVSSLGMTVILLLASMPVTAICALSGGISMALLMRAYSIILVAALTYGLFGLAVSALCQRNFTSLMLTYLGIMVMAGATWLPSVLLPQLTVMQPFFQALRSISPFEALFALNNPEHYELAIAGIFAGSVFKFYLVGMGALCALFLLIFCWFILRPPRQRRASTQSCYSDTRTNIKRKLMFPFYLIDPLKRKKPIGRFRNPIFVAELRSKVFGNPKFILRCLSACILLSMGLLTMVAMQYATQVDPESVRLSAIIFQVAVVALFAPAVCAGSLTDERSAGTLVMLRMTPLTVRQVVAGKMKAGLAYVFIFLVSSLPVLGALAYLESSSAYWRVGAWLAVLVLCTLMFVTAGLCASSLAPSTAAATAASYGFAAFLCLGTMSILLFQDRIAAEAVALVLSFNPLAAAIQITSDKWFADLPLVFGHRLWQVNLTMMGAMTLVLLILTAIRVRIIFRQRT